MTRPSSPKGKRSGSHSKTAANDGQGTSAIDSGKAATGDGATHSQHQHVGSGERTGH